MLNQLVGAGVLVVAVVGWGLLGAQAVGRTAHLNGMTRAGLVPLLGVGIVGAVTFVAGHLHLLVTALPWSLAIAAVVGIFFARTAALADLALFGRTLIEQFRAFPVLMTALSGALLLALVAGVAAPHRRDEIDYHWPAPVAWAANGGWDESPYRHVNAFPFMEVVYTAAALMESYVAAHWIHTLTLIGLGLCTAGVAQSIGVTFLVPIIAAAMVSPVVWNQSFAAYNDVGAAAFTIAALAVFMSGSYRRAAVAWACVLIAIGISIKPTSVAAVGVLALVAVLSYWWRVTPHLKSLGSAFLTWIPLAATGVVALAFWSARQYIYTGNWLDPAMTAEPDAYARTMLPDAQDWLLMPFLPFVSGLIGNIEPWGGRTSLVIQVLLVPAVVYALWRGRPVLQRFALMALPAYIHWLVLGLAIVRTRFHIMSWSLFVVAVGIAVESFVEDRPQTRRWVRLGWTLLVVLGLLDVLRQTVHSIRMI